MHERKINFIYVCMHTSMDTLLCYVCVCVCLCMSQPLLHSSCEHIGGHPFMTSTRRGQDGQAQVDACGREGRGSRPDPCGSPQRKLKLESTDVILSSSHAKKWVSFLPEFHLWTE